MSARWTIERLLEEGNDRQTQRGWEIRVDDTFVDLRDNYAEVSSRILIRRGDAPLLMADLAAIVAATDPVSTAAREAAGEGESLNPAVKSL